MVFTTSSAVGDARIVYFANYKTDAVKNVKTYNLVKINSPIKLSEFVPIEYRRITSIYNRYIYMYIYVSSISYARHICDTESENNAIAARLEWILTSGYANNLKHRVQQAFIDLCSKHISVKKKNKQTNINIV